MCECKPPPQPDRRTVLMRMEALGWSLQVCDDTCAAGWVKIVPRAGGVPVAVAYGHEAEFQRDLETCTADAEAAGAMVYS
jgi:hypothetical protein